LQIANEIKAGETVTVSVDVENIGDFDGDEVVQLYVKHLDAEVPEPVLKEEQGGFLSKILKDRFTEDQLKKLGLNDRHLKAVAFAKENAFFQMLTI